MKAIEASTTEAELRRAFEQIPGAKEPLPEQLPQPLSTLKGRLVEAMDARSKKPNMILISGFLGCGSDPLS